MERPAGQATLTQVQKHMEGKMKKRFLAALLAGMMAVMTAACGSTGSTQGTASQEAAPAQAEASQESAASAAEAAPVDPGTLKVGIYGGLDSLNPWTSGRITKDMVTYVLYETLACCENGSTEIEEILLKGWEQKDDVTYDCEIYDYITDAAGNNIKADDVVFSFEKYMENWATSVDSIEATGNYTFTLKMKTTAAGAFEYIVCKVPIASKAAFEASPDGFATTSCGTSQYTCAGGNDYVNGTTIIIRKTDSYWQTDENLIYPGSVAESDTIEFDILSEPTQMALAVENGTIDFAQYVNTSMLDEVSAYEGMTIASVPSSEDRGIMFCMTEDSPFYNDLALRQAVLYAIDNEAVAEACGYGYGSPANVTCGNPELTVGYDASWETSPYAYDPEKAKELLAQSNYDGRTLRLLCNSNATITMMWQIIQANLIEVGINAELSVVEGTTYGAYRDGTSGQYDLAYAGPGNGGYVTSDLWNTLFNRNNYESGRTWAGLLDDTLQEKYDAIAAPDGYTQENLNDFYTYITENALYYKIYDLPEYCAYKEANITGYFSDWNRFIRANTIRKAQ